jgi:hypothetical protein
MWWCRPRPALLAACVVACVAACVVAGCGGYRWVKAGAPAAGGEAVPVAVPAFVNETFEPYLGPLVTATVRSRFLDGGIVVDSGAERRLTGRITDFSDEVLAFDAAGIASNRRVVVTAQTDLKDGDTVVWSGRTRVASAEYPVTAGSTENRDAKDRALEEAAIDLADGLMLELTALKGEK